MMKDLRIDPLLILLVLFNIFIILNEIACVEVHFESADSGFFLKHTRQPPVSPEISNIHSPSSVALNSNSKAHSSYDSILSVDRFTVVQAVQPVSIRVSYGPFSTKQTVPARYVVPDSMDNQGEIPINTTAALIELQQSNMHLDISAHLVRSHVSQDSPVLRVLFHAGADPGGHLQRQKICVLLHVAMGQNEPLKGRCMPEGEDSVCVAEVVIPSHWWPPLRSPAFKNLTTQKVPQRFVQASYSVFEPPLRNAEQCEPKVQIQPLTTFAQVALVAETKTFKEIKSDESLTILMPQHALYPMSKFHVPVFLHQLDDHEISIFTMRARVKSGLKILGASSSSDAWNISIEKENTKHTTARVTAFRKDQEEGFKNTTDDTNRSFEIFCWLLQVTDELKDVEDSGKIVWTVTYVFKNTKLKDTSIENSATDETKRKLIGKVEISKDDIQAVLPMAKNWELMNTAVLTGRQVAQAMKVFIVSQAGKIADVTLQSSCHAEDESIIKVSSSCSSVYVDGSEIRGSSNASIIVKYGAYVGLAKFIVWMPEFPLEVYISDFRLSQIKGWKVTEDNHFMHNKQSQSRRKRSYIWNHKSSTYGNSFGADKVTCRARFQQSPIEVYARFIASDQNSGRISFFISRRTGLRVTDLVQPLLRVADPKIATLKGKILQGKSIGRTDVQVLSPITGRVIGAKEIRVGSDKVSLSRLIVRVVSGLQLMITQDGSIENGYIAETSITHKLTAQYQEGLLDIDLDFSDGSKTPLRDISVDDYFLLVESLDTDVVAFAPMLASHHPRVIAVGEGNGNLLRVTLLLSEDCRTRRNPNSSKLFKYNSLPLASSIASIDVDFNNEKNKHESIQNDGVIGRDRKTFKKGGDLADIIVGVPLKDSNQFYEPSIEARQHQSNLHTDKYRLHSKRHGVMTTMEIGMYVLLMTFCFAIVVFVISCVVYASKFRPARTDNGGSTLDAAKLKFHTNFIIKDSQPNLTKESTTNAHDWVWLGRSTMDRSSMVSNESTLLNDSRMRITSNPLLNYFDGRNENQSSSKSSQNDISRRLKLNECKNSNSSMDYRPPVPPHRNIGVRAVINTIKESTESNEPSQDSNINEKHNDEDHRCVKQVSKDIRSSHFNKSTLNYLNESDGKNRENIETKSLHNAEKLVENYTNFQNVFQFDSLTPRNDVDLSNTDNVDRTTIECSDATSLGTKNSLLPTNNISANGKRTRPKNAAVVGNPMFSNTLNDKGYEASSLGLDELDMDYEQIMHYFDSLKESNA